MDVLLTKVWNDKSARWKVIFILLNASFSILCALVTQNIILTVIYIIGVVIIDILVVISDYINLEKHIKKILSLKSYVKYLILIFFAALPTICGIGMKEIDFSENPFSNLFTNLVPNILGALIVCSIINHISKFDYQQIVYSLIEEKKNYVDIFIRVGFLGCYINAVNYDVNEKWQWINFFNSIYLFIIVFCGVIVFSTFVIRIIDNQNFGKTAKEVYPNMTLFVGILFLISCGAGPLFFNVGKHEPILLIMNSVTACVLIIFLLVFVSRRTENKSNTYPIVRVLLFIIAAGINCIYNCCKCDEVGDWPSQLFSGGGILAIVLIALLFANKMQRARTRVDEQLK